MFFSAESAKRILQTFVLLTLRANIRALLALTAIARKRR